MKVSNLFVILGAFSFCINVEMALQPVKLKLEGRHVSKKDPHIKIVRSDMTDIITIAKQVTQQSNIKIFYWVVDDSNEEVIYEQEFNICNNKVRGQDANVRDYVLRSIGIKEKTCPFKKTKQPKKVERNKELTISLEMKKYISDVYFAVEISEPTAAESILYESWKTEK